VLFVLLGGDIFFSVVIFVNEDESSVVRER